MSSRASTFEPSIIGDQIEQNRIQLERNLQHTDISLHLSNPSDASDVEYPRHISNNHSFSAIASFDYPSPTNQRWSYRTLDEDDRTHPFAQETVSTAAHHASALTISAGLGGRGARRDISFSGAEYDPDRPLQGIIENLDVRGLSDRSSKHRHLSTTVDFDPLVVEDTMELDNIIQTCRSQNITIVRSPSPSSSSTSGSDRASVASGLRSPRPKLSDALHHGTFSPSRPRTAHSTLPRKVQPPVMKRDFPVSAKSARNRSTQSLSYATQAISIEDIPRPAVNVQPPTPRRVDISATPARSALRQANHTEGQTRVKSVSLPREPAASSSGRPTSRMAAPEPEPPLHHIASIPESHSIRIVDEQQTPRSRNKGKVYLPDVTGLTSAVGSPARFTRDYRKYEVAEEREVDARIIATLGAVQSRLVDLEVENRVSMKRVRDLELELEDCRKEVARERARVIEHEKKAIRLSPRKMTRQRGDRVDAQTGDVGNKSQSRYEEAVAETRALEGLISTLRAHLSRLTAELSDHKRLLEELRTLRDGDSRALKQKGRDVERLQQEVERLAGEVEVLKGVVEEGLKERRQMRGQHSLEASRHSDDEAVVTSNPQHRDDDASESDEEAVDRDTNARESERMFYPQDSHPVSRASTPSSPLDRSIASVAVSDRSNSRQNVNGTIRAATPLRLDNSGSQTSQAYIGDDELRRISEEMEERRTERSVAMSRSGTTDSNFSRSQQAVPPLQSRSTTPLPKQLTGNRADVPQAAQNMSQNALDVSNTTRRQTIPESPTNRAPSIPMENNRPTEPPQPSSSTNPFPQIRGSRMEKMFFATKEHDFQTCSTCHRRTTTRNEGRNYDWLTEHAKLAMAGKHGIIQEDEGFAEEPERVQSPRVGSKGNHTVQGDGIQNEKLPPQTVLTRVVRELEDDFSHYKMIYTELAEQYRIIDAASNSVKRNVLARHLQDVIDLLEQKGDQIASLYDLLNFKDQPDSRIKNQ
ncbi:hypothetical protein C8Q75DRAFT_893963 [Abortiporus biennis]|nr:hypothetical protein C8Q75DRAFT_893963 [Abortiporus biennis]